MHFIPLLCSLSLLFLLANAIPEPVNYSFVPSYGNVSSNGTIFVRFYGLIYQRRANNNNGNDTLNFGSSFIDQESADALNNAALTPVEKQNLQENLDPFVNWNLLKDQIISFDINGENVTTTKKTGIDGQFDEFLNFTDDSLKAPVVVNYTATNPVDAQKMEGNATILDPTGYSMIVDIDDVLRITKIWEPLTGLKNTFMEPYQPVPEMPELLKNMKKLPNSGFHYATTTPMPVAATYIRWIYTVYPFGSLDMRPINIADPGDILTAREDQLTRLQQTFPKRKFIMIGDISSNTLVKAYPNFARQFPNNTACIYLRNTTFTYPNYSNPTVNLEKEFQGVPRQQWFVFDKPSDLFNVDFTSGNCHPPGIPLNQTTKSGGYGGTSSNAHSLIMSLWSAILVVGIAFALL